eukprot:6490997-Amphidinium_carterae.1
MDLLAHTRPSGLSGFMDNSSELATVLSMNQMQLGFDIVYDYMLPDPLVDVSEFATTFDPDWTTMCDHRCSVHQIIYNSSSTLKQESDMYQFDASHLAWSLGRFGLYSRFIVAFTNNGSTSYEELPAVDLGVIFEFLLLPHLCARPCLEPADPQSIEAMRVLAFKWKRYLKLKADLYNPRTQNHCLFMCAAYILRRHGIVMTQQQVRDRTAKLWLAGAECFGGSMHHWAAVRQLTSTSFIEQLRSTGWGSAADACIFANSLQASCYIYDHRGDLLVSSPCSRSLFNMNFRLAGDHYTAVDDANIVCAQRHQFARYSFRSRPSQHWRLLTHLPSHLRACRSCDQPRAPRTGSSCSSRSSLPSCGGAMRAQTQVTPSRQFQIVGRGEDGFTPHIVQNEHDLAIYAAHAPVPEEDQPAMEGYSCILPLEDDDRPFILTRLSQLTVQLLAIARVGPHPEGPDHRGAYQSCGSTPKPSCSCSFYQVGSAGASDLLLLNTSQTMTLRPWADP